MKRFKESLIPGQCLPTLATPRKNQLDLVVFDMKGTARPAVELSVFMQEAIRVVPMLRMAQIIHPAFVPTAMIGHNAARPAARLSVFVREAIFAVSMLPIAQVMHPAFVPPAAVGHGVSNNWL